MVFKNALMIGNGLNRAVDNCAWVDMLDALRQKYGVAENHQCRNLPLEYERIYFSSHQKIGKDYTLKKEVATLLPQVQDFSLHQQFVSLPVEHILTTNYDYHLEQAVLHNFNRKKSFHPTKERLHSVSRYYETLDKKIWHIHGEQQCPDSICLGYGQYCAYLAKMHEILAKPRNGVCKTPYIDYYLQQHWQFTDLWMTLFFTHNIFIFGLDMKFIEIDLWWLLNYRSRFLLEKTQYGITNQIHYFFIEAHADMEQIAVLRSMGILLHPMDIKDNNWSRVYQEIYKQIIQSF